MIQQRKQGQRTAEQPGLQAQVRSTVESVLADIQTRGDGAVRDYSAKFDRWSPENFRLTDAQIQACVASLPAQTLDDIRYAQSQIRTASRR